MQQRASTQGAITTFVSGAGPGASGTQTLAANSDVELHQPVCKQQQQHLNSTLNKPPIQLVSCAYRSEAYRCVFDSPCVSCVERHCTRIPPPRATEVKSFALSNGATAASDLSPT